MEPEILYEDNMLIVCVKPAGMPSQDDHSSAMDMASWLKNHTVKGDGKRPPYIGVVHRLDRPVGGVMVYAKTPQAARELSRQFAEHTTEKIYMAVLTGKPPKKEGTLTDWLAKGDGNLSVIVPAGTAGAKEARLSYRVLRSRYMDGVTWTLVRIALDTGRRHQIRAQMAHAGAGVYGDRKYDPSGPILPEGDGIGLFAAELTFVHPRTRKKMTFKARPKQGIFELFPDGQP